MAACAVRTFACTETFMPMKPAAPDSTAPIRKPIATKHAEEVPDHHEDRRADDADGRVLPLEIGLRALAHGAGDLLHARVAGIGLQHRHGRPGAIGDGEQTANDDHRQELSLDRESRSG